MSNELGEELIKAVYSSIKSGEQLTDPSLASRLSDVVKVHKAFMRLESAVNKSKAELEDLHDNDKRIILEIFTKNLKKPTEVIDWNLNLVLSNSTTFKCLMPKVELSVKGVDLEFDVETFNQLRYEVARGLLRLQKYEDIA